MVKKTNDDLFDGFTLGDLSSMLTPDVDDPSLPKSVGDDSIPVVDPDDIVNKDDDDDDDTTDDSKDDSDDDSNEPVVDPKVDDDIDDDNEPDDDPDDDKDDDIDDDEPEDLGELEPDISKFFMERMAEELGWSLSEEEKFESVSDVIEYMQGIVENASKPEYASEEVQAFDDFVKNGGTLRKFYDDTISGTLDLNEFDIESEENQRAIIREDLRNQGLSEKQISRKIERYETAGVLEDEAEDSKDNVETFRKKKAETLLKDQEKYAEQVQSQQQKFIDDVQSYVKKLNDIRGIQISEADKKKLLNDIFRADETGQTAYQKTYSSNIAKNLVESAFFTLQGDKLLDKVQKKERTSAAKDLKRKLNTSKSKRTKAKDNDQDTYVSGGLGLLSDQLL